MPARILIIEDDNSLMRGLKDNFESRGYEVTLATDGEQGLESLLHREPDLVLLDIMLPKINGFEVCQAARREGVTVPIIMLTAKGQEEDTIRGLELGADDYVKKPFNVRELAARVKAFLRRHAAELPPQYCFGDCRVDQISQKLFRGGREVVLTRKEFRLLTYFARQEGRALTWNQILRAVWGNGVLVTSRSVDRCVTTLRAKVEADPRKPRFIRTIREVGYRFECGE